VDREGVDWRAGAVVHRAARVATPSTCADGHVGGVTPGLHSPVDWATLRTDYVCSGHEITVKSRYRSVWIIAGCLLAPSAIMAGGPVNSDPHHAAERHEWLEQFQNAQYFWQQLEVARRIVALHDRRVLPPLARWLTAEDRHVRGNAAFISASLGDHRGYEVIVALLNDRSWRPTGQGIPGFIGLRGSGYDSAPQIRADRYYAAHLLGDLKDPRAVAVLIPLLTDRDVQYIVPWSLGQIGDPAAVAPLIQTLSDKNPDMRVLAMYGLEQLHATEALPALYRLIDDTEKTHFDKLIPVGEAAKEVIAQLEAR
jgi:HEAT repeats